MIQLERARDLLLLVFVIFAGCQNYSAFQGYVFEDAYITYRYAENLASGQGFVFNPGERILGTSTPLFALLLAFLHLLGFDLEVAGGVLTSASLSFLALGGAWFLRKYGSPNLGVLYALVVLWGTGGILFFWGMETAFYSLLLMGGAISAALRRDVATGIFVGLAFITRHDAVLFASVIFFLIALDRRRVPWKIGAVAGACIVPWYLFSLLYFGSLLPNTLGAKAGSVETSSYGFNSLVALAERFLSPLFRYVSREGYEPVHVLGIFLFAVTPVFFWGRKVIRKEFLLLLLLLHPLALWLGYSWIAPPLEHQWYLLPGMYLLLLLSCIALGEGYVVDRRFFGPAAVSLVLLVVSFAELPQKAREEASRVTEREGYRGRILAYAQMAAWIRHHELTNEKLFTREPGYLTYLTKNPVIDGAGLVTKGIRFHGQSGRSTSLGEILGKYRPGLVIHHDHPSVGRSLRDYLLFFQTRTRGLFIARDALSERIIRGWWQEKPYYPEKVTLRHPVEFDFEDGEASGFWGAPGIVGRPVELVGRKNRSTGDYLTTHGAVTRRRESILMSPPFHVDFDELTFLFAATKKQWTSAQLLVQGQVVESVDGGSDSGTKRLRRVVWPVYFWRGKIAQLRFVDRSSDRGFLAADQIKSVRYSAKRTFDDFEEGVYGERWSGAFGDRPTEVSRVVPSLGLRAVAGRYSALSLRVPGRQKMTSRPFPLEYARIAIRVFDLGGKATKVKLIVGGKVVRRFDGENTGVPRSIVWDVSRFHGREAILEAVDNDLRPEKGVGIDEILFFNP